MHDCRKRWAPSKRAGLSRCGSLDRPLHQYQSGVVSCRRGRLEHEKTLAVRGDVVTAQHESTRMVVLHHLGWTKGDSRQPGDRAPNELALWPTFLVYHAAREM